MSGWFILGFTPDDVVIAGQDSRLALVCKAASQKEAAAFDILQRAGDEVHLIRWYVSLQTTELLTKHAIDWRQFLVGETDAPPEDAFPVLGETTL